MSAPRPYETDPFHSPSSVHILCWFQLPYISKSVLVMSYMWYVWYEAHLTFAHVRFLVFSALFVPLDSGNRVNKHALVQFLLFTQHPLCSSSITFEENSRWRRRLMALATNYRNGSEPFCSESLIT